MENRLCQFVQMGHAKQLTKPVFYLAGGQLVLQGTKRWDLERNNDDDENDRISTNRTDNSVGDDRGGEGGRGSVRGAPRTVTAQTRAEERGDGDHWQGWAGIPSAERGGVVPAEAAAEDPPLWPGAPA